MASQSINCCVTSPPYWGLRDYHVAGRIWGGDPGHKHVWGMQVVQHATNHTDKRRWNHARNGRGEQQPKAKRPGWKRQPIAQGNFCGECGAWRGVLGLEPSPELYVEHIVEVFREVQRVLRDDGTLWLNMGDCYSGDGGVGAMAGTGLGSPARAAMPRPEAADPANFARWRREYGGLKPKDLVGMPWRVAFALQADGWYLRSDIIWHKPNPMPESVRDRPTKAHEYLFLLSKSERYYYDADAIKEPASPDTHARYARGRSDNHKWADGGPGNQTRRAPGVNPKCAAPGSGIRQNSSFSAAVKDVVGSRNKRSVWTISTKPYSGAHFATFPPKLIEPCILAGCSEGGTVLDPFGGAGTTALVAREHNRNSILIELCAGYVDLARERLGLNVEIA